MAPTDRTKKKDREEKRREERKSKGSAGARTRTRTKKRFPESTSLSLLVTVPVILTKLLACHQRSDIKSASRLGRVVLLFRADFQIALTKVSLVIHCLHIRVFLFVKGSRIGVNVIPRPTRVQRVDCGTEKHEEVSKTRHFTANGGDT